MFSENPLCNALEVENGLNKPIPVLKFYFFVRWIPKIRKQCFFCVLWVFSAPSSLCFKTGVHIWHYKHPPSPNQCSLVHYQSPGMRQGPFFLLFGTICGIFPACDQYIANIPFFRSAPSSFLVSQPPLRGSCLFQLTSQQQARAIAHSSFYSVRFGEHLSV